MIKLNSLRFIFLFAPFIIFISSCSNEFNGKDGIKTVYFPNSKLIKQVVGYKNGKRNGSLKEYYRNGNLKINQFYQDDFLTDSCITYYENGNIQLVQFIKDKKKEGAWKKFNEQIQAQSSLSVALIWQADSCGEASMADFYPGDELVDWVSTNYECADATLQFAREHYKPVMLEATSLGGWNEWYAPFFKFVMDNNDVVRAVIYINADKSQLTDTDIIKSWKTETKQPFWLHAKPNLFGNLGFDN